MSTTGTEAIDEEIAREKAESLGLAARRLETALRDLRDTTPAPRPDRIQPGPSATGSSRGRHIAFRTSSFSAKPWVFGILATYSMFYSVPPEIVARIGVRER